MLSESDESNNGGGGAGDVHDPAVLTGAGSHCRFPRQ